MKTYPMEAHHFNPRGGHMIKLIKVSTLAGMALLAMGAQAQSMYGELGFGALTYKEPGLKLKPGMVRGLLGYQISPNVSAEGMLGVGANTDTAPGSGATLKVNNMAGVFVKAQANVTNSFAVYGRLGGAYTKLRVSGVSDSGSSVAYGLGVSYDISKSLYLNADYMNYYDRNNQKIDGYTLGVGLRF
jgi:opacity protein-like surface antigen